MIQSTEDCLENVCHFFQAINGTLKHASLCPRAGLIDGLDFSSCIYNVNAVLELSRIKIAEDCRSHVA